MGMRIDGGDQTPPKNLREAQQQSEQNRNKLKKLRLIDQLQKIQARMNELKGKDNEDVAIRGFTFEYATQTTPDTEAIYKTLEAQYKALLQELEEVERQFDEQKNMQETELILKQEIEQEQQRLKAEQQEVIQKDIRNLAPKFIQ